MVLEGLWKKPDSSGQYNIWTRLTPVLRQVNTSKACKPTYKDISYILSVLCFFRWNCHLSNKYLFVCNFDYLYYHMLVLNLYFSFFSHFSFEILIEHYTHQRYIRVTYAGHMCHIDGISKKKSKIAKKIKITEKI